MVQTIQSGPLLYADGSGLIFNFADQGLFLTIFGAIAASKQVPFSTSIKNFLFFVCFLLFCPIFLLFLPFLFYVAIFRKIPSLIFPADIKIERKQNRFCNYIRNQFFNSKLSIHLKEIIKLIQLYLPANEWIQNRGNSNII